MYINERRGNTVREQTYNEPYVVVVIRRCVVIMRHATIDIISKFKKMIRKFAYTDGFTGSNFIRQLFQLAAAECLKQRDAETVRLRSTTNIRKSPLYT